MLEYALLAAMIAVVAIGSIGFVGNSAKETFYQSGEAMVAAAHNPDAIHNTGGGTGGSSPF